jgi:nitronate monooxygenase
MKNSEPRRVLGIEGVELPILQAPMAGSNGSAMAAAVSRAGGLGALPCAMLDPAGVRRELLAIRQVTSAPINLNFFAHREPAPDAAREAAWRSRLAAYATELGVEIPAERGAGSPRRAPFDAAMCDVVVELAPAVVSFHFGLPEPGLVDRVRAAGAKILSSATTVAEARWLEDHGCDAIIAQGAEAGGHRGVFLTENAATQVGTMALVPQVVDAVKLPVIAAGGISDARGMMAAFVLGASAVQIGTAYLFCSEATISGAYTEALREVRDDSTVLTNVFSGRPARGVANRLVRELGPLSPLAPAFPNASGALGPLRARAEAAGSGDFSPLWAGQAAPIAAARARTRAGGGAIGAGELTKCLADEARAVWAALQSQSTAWPEAQR